MHKQQPIQELEILFSLRYNVTTSHTAAGASSATANGIGVNTYDGTTGVATVGSITEHRQDQDPFPLLSHSLRVILQYASEYSDFGSVTITSAGTQNKPANAPGTVTAAHAITLTVLVTLDQPQQVSL
ncbi:MAG: hypothetical protein CM15mV6_1640 [uncultured marine virus]|nr:MAG: hypothetical protein CM15mV6_1640 [uncultured marine virus]